MKKKKFLILLAGSPGTGKTYLMNLLQEKLKEMYIVTPDEIKVYYAEKYGFNNLEEKAEIEKDKVWPFYYKALDLYMEAGKKIIATEYPFSFKQKDNLDNLAKKYGYHIITIRLIADFNVLWERRYKRDRENDRHLSYIMSRYHYGDVLEEREHGTNHITKDEFKAIIDARKYDSFSLGTCYEFDVTDYDKVNYESFIDELYSIIFK